MNSIFNFLLRSYALAFCSFCLLQGVSAQCDTILDQDFNHWDNRRYTIQDAKDDFNNQIKPWTAGSYRGIAAPGAAANLIDDTPQETRIVDGTLRAEYKKNDASGRSGGCLFDPYFDGVEEAYLEYKVKFDKDFFWATGGKLPGLGGSIRGIGSETEGRGAIPSGCGYNDDGWSARLMWRRNRAQTIPPYLILYSYFAEKPDGSPRQETSDCGDNYRIFTGLEDDTWYTIRQYIKLNTPGQRDGVAVMWVDNEETFRKEDLMIRKAGKDDLKINALVMNTYRGGARTDPVWHSPRDEFAFFDDFKVWTGGLSCVGINEKPTIDFDSPAGDTTLMPGDDLIVTVSAADTDGRVDNVKLYVNNTLVRVLDSLPYIWGDSLSNDTLLQNLSEGIYTLRAAVEDNEGSTNTTEITVIVGEISTAPTVSFAMPTEGSTYQVGDNIVILANAEDPNGTIANVKFYLNEAFIREEKVIPYEWGHRNDLDPQLKNMAAGTYQFKVVAEDDDGETASAEITVTVDPTTSDTNPEAAVIKIIPNVSADRINLHLPTRLLWKDYRIVDLSGSIVRTIRPQQEVEIVDITDLRTGMYFIAFGRVSKRFVKR
ncbi:MAG: polysaccharide lyase [Bacteroidota bacterium]